MRSWPLLTQLVGGRTAELGTAAAVDHFMGWNGLRWGEALPDDMYLDRREADGTPWYLRMSDVAREAAGSLWFADYSVKRVLYSYVDGRLSGIGFWLDDAADFDSLSRWILASYGDPGARAEPGRMAWWGQRIAARVAPIGEAGSLSWFHLYYARGLPPPADERSEGR